MRRRKIGRYRRTVVRTEKGQIAVYASPKVRDALNEIAKDMTLYQGVRLSQVLEAVYRQGEKDGAGTAFEATDRKLLEAKRQVRHRNPGRPKKK